MNAPLSMTKYMFGECVRRWYSGSTEGGAREGAREVKEQAPGLEGWRNDVIRSGDRLHPPPLPHSGLFSAASCVADVRATFLWHRQVSSHRPWFPAGRLVILSTSWCSGFCWQCSPPDWVFQSPLCYLQTCQGETGKGLPYLLQSRLSQILRRENMIGPCWASVLPGFEGNWYRINMAAEGVRWRVRQAAPRQGCSVRSEQVFQRPLLHWSKLIR